jgi:hypothetical protein
VSVTQSRGATGRSPASRWCEGIPAWRPAAALEAIAQNRLQRSARTSGVAMLVGVCPNPTAGTRPLTPRRHGSRVLAARPAREPEVGYGDRGEQSPRGTRRYACDRWPVPAQGVPLRRLRLRDLDVRPSPGMPNVSCARLGADRLAIAALGARGRVMTPRPYPCGSGRRRSWGAAVDRACRWEGSAACVRRVAADDLLAAGVP